MRRRIGFCKLLLLLAFCPMVFGQNINLSNAYQELQEVEEYLAKENISTQTLKNMLQTTSEVQEQTLACVANEQLQLNEIAQLDAELSKLSPKYSNYKADKDYIQAKNEATTKRLFECRLLASKALDTQQHILDKIEAVANANTSVAGKPIYEAISGIFLTIGAVLIFTAIVYLGNIIFDHATLHNLTIIRRQHYPEFIIFKFSLYALLAIWVILMLLEWWGVPNNILAKGKHLLLEGGTIYGVGIIPMRLFLGFMAFAGIQIAWKYTLLYVANKQKVDPESDSHVVLTSILSYVVFAVAILIGLGISGVNFTGLAIVAGALSVGIGFGLQNIVNNFVSGIILLLEKTIKPGDRVLVKGYEGIVRKINLRFTRIATANKDDVLIPNSDLISTPIINFEFEDKIGAVRCFVGVAYGSDLELVRQTLLNVAIKHLDVLNDPLNKPKVFLNEFGECNIMFELECIIQDVNRKHIVTSDLYFQIAKAFQEQKIAISLPQREVHILQGG